MWKWEWLCWFINRISSGAAQRVRRYERAIERLSREVDHDRDWWAIFQTYSKDPRPTNIALGNSLPASSETIQDHSLGTSTGVVIQGPVVTENDLTLRTIDLYQRTMPGVPLILSTWNESDTETLQRIRRQGVTIVTNPLPKAPGPYNLNLQVASTQAGLSEAKRIGCRYAIKTRSDTRIQIHQPDQLFRTLQRQHPLGPKSKLQGSEHSEQEERILILDSATRLFVPYHPSDMLMYGTTDDLLNYWRPQFCPPETQFHEQRQYADMLLEPTPEVVLCRRFLENEGVQLQDTIAQWWEILASRFLVVDRAMIDWFWPKYDYHIEQRLESLRNTQLMALCRHCDWLRIHYENCVPSVDVEQLREHRVDALAHEVAAA